MIVHIARATRHLLFWSLITVAVAVSAVRIFLAELDDYQIELEQKIRQMTDIPLRIGKMEAGMRGFNPEVILQGIRVEATDPQNKPDIQLKEIRLGLDFLQLLLTRNWLSASRVTLVGANISITRHMDGSFAIKGLQASDGQPLWLLQGGKYEILDSEITWQDLKRHGKAVHFDRFDLVIKNHFFDKSHEVHLLSKLPPLYGDALRISAVINGHAFDTIAGELYVEGTNLQAGALNADDLPLGLHLQSGSGDIRVRSLWRNASPYQIDGYIQAQQLKISKNQAPPLAMDTFAGNFSWSDDNGRWRLAGYDITIDANRQRWSKGAFDLQQNAQGNLSAVIRQLDLPAAMLLAPLLMPDDHNYSEWLKLNPKGRLQDVSVFVSHDFQHYAARGRFDQLGNDHFQAIPKIQNISGEFSLTNSYGQIALDTQNANIDASDWFRNPIAIRRLQGNVHWWQTEDAWQFFSKSIVMDSTDFATVSKLNLWLPKSNASAVLDLRTRFGEFKDISHVPNYLPANIMSPDAVAWLDDAFVAGQIKQGELVIKGALDQFPFANGPGRFETVFGIENSEIQFNEDWPHLHNAYADVQFLGEDLQVAISQGSSEKVDIDQALVTIPDLADSNHVYVWGQVHAKLMESLDFLQKSPLKTKIEPIAALLDGEGAVGVDLSLKIPYAETESVKVNVNAHLNAAKLSLKPINLKVDGIKGILNFTEDRISSNLMNAGMLGYPIQARLSSDEQATYLVVEGKTSIDNLEKQFSFLQNEIVDGGLSYTAKLTLPYDTKQANLLKIDSSLKGVSVKSQTVLGKSADEARPLILDFQLDDKVKMPLALQYGNQLSAALLIDKTQGTLYSGHVVLGQDQASRYDKPGLKLEVRQPRFNLSEALAAFAGDESGKQSLVKEVLIDTGQLIWQDQDLEGMRCDLQHDNQGWQGTIDTAMARGRISIPDQLGGNNRILLKMDYLNLSALEKLSVNRADEVMSNLPLIDIDSTHLWWRSVDLGVLKLQTDRLSNGIHFKKIQLQSAKTTLDLTADWLKQATGTVTQIKGNIKSEQFGAFLSRLNFTEDFKETTADISFNGGWRGGPHQFAMDRLNGQLELQLKDGRISSIEPGFGRLLGLVAMEQWVKRLSLDFSDVYRQGLAFDDIKGHIKIKDGLAFTDDLTVNAVAAKFYLAGFADLAQKTLDQRVMVVPSSTEAVPIAGTIVDSVASMITRVVTGDDKEGFFFGSQYQLKGAWGNVEVSPLHEGDGLINKTWRGLTDFGWLGSDVE